MEATTGVPENDSAQNNTSKSEEPFDYDAILEHVGQIGKFQLVTCIALCYPAIFTSTMVMSYAFTGFIPEYSCFIEGCNQTQDNFNCNNQNLSSCFRYNETVLDQEFHCNTKYADPTLLQQCDTWIYDTSISKSTIATEFDLTCDSEWKVTLASSLYMAGMLLGGAATSHIADLLGRRKGVLLTSFIGATAMTVSAFVPNFTYFAILRFICGMTDVFFGIIIIWGVEATGKDYQIRVGFIYQALFTVGACLLGLVGYFIRDWRTFQLTIGVAMYSVTIISWFLPESTRWLISKKRYEEARRLILRSAEMNGKSVPAHLMVVPSQNEGEIVDGNVKEAAGETIIDVLRSRPLLKRMCLLFTTWMAIVMSYYGTTFSFNTLSDSFYLNYQLGMIIELPGYFIGMYCMDKLGRRISVCGSIVVGGFACLATGLLPEDPATYRLVLCIFAKFFISTSFAGVYSYTSELFPTAARSAAVGVCSTFGRLGGILAPIIDSMGRSINPALPYIIFAIFNIIVGTASFLLPETNRTPLPSNIAEAEAMSM